MKSAFTLLAAKRHPEHARMWPGKLIGVFARKPMKYVVVFNEDKTPELWPKSLTEGEATALVDLLPQSVK